jgi:carboxypeptidase PM20D1
MFAALLFGNTDTKHYLSLSRNIYRFSPSYLDVSDLRRFHGVNERIAVADYQRVINFYCHMIINADVESVVSAEQPGGHSADL